MGSSHWLTLPTVRTPFSDNIAFLHLKGEGSQNKNPIYPNEAQNQDKLAPSVGHWLSRN